jgi:hypothetical protein
LPPELLPLDPPLLPPLDPPLLPPLDEPLELPLDEPLLPPLDELDVVPPLLDDESSREGLASDPQSNAHIAADIVRTVA